LETLLLTNKSCENNCHYMTRTLHYMEIIGFNSLDDKQPLLGNPQTVNLKHKSQIRRASTKHGNRTICSGSANTPFLSNCTCDNKNVDRYFVVL